MGDLVTLEVVATEQEAGIIASVLGNEGIESLVRPTNVAVGMGDGLAIGGPREIVVRSEDLVRAREVLEDQRGLT